jgi:hypothetical protein
MESKLLNLQMAQGLETGLKFVELVASPFEQVHI